MLVLANEIPRARTYQLLIGSIVPRPVAWISSVGADGTRILAPFSYFMGVYNDPPMLAVSINARRGQRKDSLRNIEETGAFVVNVANEPLLERMVLTSGEWAYGADEFDVAGFTAAPSAVVKVPRVQEAPISMECRLHHVVRLGRAPHLTGLVVGEIVAWHFDDAILDERGLPDMQKLQPVGRMIGDEYILLRDRKIVPRPQGDSPPPPRKG